LTKNFQLLVEIFLSPTGRKKKSSRNQKRIAPSVFSARKGPGNTPTSQLFDEKFPTFGRNFSKSHRSKKKIFSESKTNRAVGWSFQLEKAQETPQRVNFLTKNFQLLVKIFLSPTGRKKKSSRNQKRIAPLVFSARKGPGNTPTSQLFDEKFPTFGRNFSKSHKSKKKSSRNQKRIAPLVFSARKGPGNTPTSQLFDEKFPTFGRNFSKSHRSKKKIFSESKTNRAVGLFSSKRPRKHPNESTF
jgi:hypothetical protein